MERACFSDARANPTDFICPRGRWSLSVEAPDLGGGIGMPGWLRGLQFGRVPQTAHASGMQQLDGMELVRSWQWARAQGETVSTSVGIC